MLNVLINAYAISPNWGSEPGMGWNWVINLAKYCNLHIITEGEWKDDIESAVQTLPQKDHLHFYYNPLPDKIRRMCWNQGDWRFYWCYHKWQKRTLTIARQICKEQRIDVIHQLNMVGFREPGCLWKIKNIPYVWGPFCGCSPVSLPFIKDAGYKIFWKFLIKNIISQLQIRFQPNVIHAIKRADILLTPHADIKSLIGRLYNKEPFLLQETGIKGDCVPPKIFSHSEKKTFDILWVGRFIFTKRLDIALKTIARLKHIQNLRFHIVGSGLNNEDVFYKRMADQLDISSICIWHGALPNDQVQIIMQNVDIFFFTSISEATSTVVLEAIQNRCPIVCHNACGFGPLINDKIGRKIQVVSPQSSIKQFAEVIENLYNNRHELDSMIPQFDELIQPLTYEAKARQILDIYTHLVLGK